MTTQSYRVAGMTCDHCVAAIDEEMRNVAGVRDVVIDLAPGDVTTVTVTSDAPLPLDDVRAAVDEAGYDLVT